MLRLSRGSSQTQEAQIQMNPSQPETPVVKIVIPASPPVGIVDALRNFVEAVEGYGETGVWPDNGTIWQLADKGRDALNCGHATAPPAEAPVAGVEQDL